MTDEFRIRELEQDRTRHLDTIADQKTTILFLTKMLGKAWAERDHARDIAVAAEVEVARLSGGHWLEPD